MWRARSMLLSGLAIASSLAIARPAPAQSVFEIPPGCGSEAEFRSELERLLGDAASRAAPSLLVIRPNAVDGAGHVLRLQMGEEVREIHDPDCRTLLRSAVVISAAAWRLEPPPLAAAPDRAVSAAPAPVPTAPVPTAPVPTPTRVVPRSASAAPVVNDQPRATTYRYAMRLGVGVEGGVLPGLAPLLELGAGVEPSPFGFAVSLRYLPEQDAERDGRGMTVGAWGGRFAALVRPYSFVHLSAGLDVNRLSGTGDESVSRRGSDAAWQVAPSLGVSAIPWSVGYLRLELGLEGHVGLVRPRFVVTGFGDVYRVPEFGGGAIVRGAWLFR